MCTYIVLLDITRLLQKISSYTVDVCETCLGDWIYDFCLGVTKHWSSTPLSICIISKITELTNKCSTTNSTGINEQRRAVWIWKIYGNQIPTKPNACVLKIMLLLETSEQEAHVRVREMGGMRCKNFSTLSVMCFCT
jgi:hypothetical protein